MIFQLQDLNKYTAPLLPDECRSCGWWQARRDDPCSAAATGARAEAAEEASGSWGKLALADDELLGMVQYGPSGLFPRSRELPSGPVSPDAVLLTCGAVSDKALESVIKSLITAVMAELRQRQVDAIEAFCSEDVKLGKTCHYLSADLLRDCGFYPVRTRKALKLMRLELGGIQPTRKCRAPRRGILERIKSRSAAPAPVAMARSLKKCKPAACPQDG